MLLNILDIKDDISDLLILEVTSESKGGEIFDIGNLLIVAKFYPHTVENGDTLVRIGRDCQVRKYLQIDEESYLVSINHKEPVPSLCIKMSEYYIVRGALSKFC